MFELQDWIPSLVMIISYLAGYFTARMESRVDKLEDKNKKPR